MRRISASPDMIEFIRDVIEYQFDTSFAEIIVERVAWIEVSKTGVPRFIHSSDGLLLVFRPSDGLFSLTPLSGAILHGGTTDKYRVVADSGVVLRGSLLAPGVMDCWDGVRGGDEVLIVSEEDSLMGIGRAKMSCKDMRSVPRGEVVRVRYVL